ncbi:MAG: ATP-binding cassette domain-containing protein [Selenomonadaceae bacterium]|nr:ATP-binding cassette domain-containing protein [Selenomonadaceae bacterium]
MKLKFLPAIVANISAALSEILLMASAAWLIASAALHPPLSALSVGITLVRTAGISRAALRYADRFLSHKIIFASLDDLREEIFRRVAKVLPLKSGRTHEGELLHALTISADLLKDFLPRVILPLVTAALVTVLLTGFLFAPLKMFALTLPAIFVATIILSALLDAQATDDSLYREKILDFTDGRDELKIFGVEPAIQSLDTAAKTFGADSFRLTARQINFDTAIKIFVAAGFFFVLLKLGATVDKIALTVWALIFLATLELFAQIPSSIRTWKKIRAVTLPDEKNLSRVPCRLSLINNAVEMRNVTFGYSSEKILRDLSLTVKRGEMLAIVGESGAGKTTLLYLLTKLFAAESGTVATGGTISASTFANYIFSASIRANFKIYCGDVSDEKIFDALKLCGLDGFDIDSEIGFDGAKLSGGERNRLQIALALSTEPGILILDEPTAGLDKSRAESLVTALVADSRKKNRTLIVITHDSNYFAELGRFELGKTLFP